MLAFGSAGEIPATGEEEEKRTWVLRLTSGEKAQDVRGTTLTLHFVFQGFTNPSS